ncbi:LysR substrate-binding domain-containing protein [Aquimarina addita]|uniref:LysR substrate-binding domain-containing protein n=1 Tax=Aquimarina addita TaxID=870485 RepID=A0ABP7XCS1_9FLAO
MKDFDTVCDFFSNCNELFYCIFESMEIKYFRLIKTIAEAGNIANSSKQLFLTQSALSHQLRMVENHLGCKVFTRTRNTWKLTEEGTALYALANELLETLEKGLNSVTEIKEGVKGTIKISTECYSFYQGLASFIQKMGVLYPEIEIDLILNATHQPIAKMLTREIDIALVSSIPDAKELSGIPVFDDEIFAVMHKEHPLADIKYITAKDFENIHLIIHSFPLDTVSVFEHFLRPAQVMPSKVSAIPLTEVSLEMVNANMGIMCIPKWALASFKLSEDFRFKKIGRQGLKRTHYLVIRNEDVGKKYITNFIDNFQEEFLVI